MKTNKAPFYSAVNNLKPGSDKPWFKKAQKGTESRTQANLKNHSDRKTMIQTLVNNDLLPTDILQLSAHTVKMHKVSLATQPSHRNNSLTCVALSLD